MKKVNDIHKLIKKLNVAPSADMDRKVHNRITEALEKWEKTKSADIQPNIWRIIMKSKITKLAAAVVIIIAVLIVINQFGNTISVSSVAFGEVLGYIQKHSYTFDLTAEFEGLQTIKMQGMVWELGWMRVDCSAGGVGKISSITDLNAGRTLLLFHQNKAGVIKKESFLNKNTGAGGIVSFCTKPIENLWNVCDGTEEQLVAKEINNQNVVGFRVLQEDRYFKYDITIWADSESGFPSMVEAIAKPFDKSYPTIKWSMDHFNLNVKLDEKLFSLDLPEGYTLAYQEDLDKFEVETKVSNEAEKIVRMLELWSEGKKDEAIKSLLGIDWTKPIEFSKEPYIFSLTEKGYISLKAEDQKQVMEKIMATASTIRNITNETLAIGKTAVANQDYERAEQYFEAPLRLGELLARNPESMIIVRLVGIAAQKAALNEIINLHKTTNNQEKLQMAEKQLQAAEAEGKSIKNKEISQ